MQKAQLGYKLQEGKFYNSFLICLKLFKTKMDQFASAVTWLVKCNIFNLLTWEILCNLTFQFSE